MSRNQLRALTRQARKMLKGWKGDGAKQAALEGGLNWDSLDWDLGYRIEKPSFCAHAYEDQKAGGRCSVKAVTPLKVEGYTKSGYHVTKRTMILMLALAEVRAVPWQNILAHIHSLHIHKQVQQTNLDENMIQPGWLWPLVVANPKVVAMPQHNVQERLLQLRAKYLETL